MCERFALSQIKHHRYLSVNSNEIKREIEAVKEKFLTHGKYDVAREFENLIQSFLTNFNFDRHPQYDVQWSLLSLLLNLATETNNSELSSKHIRGDGSRNESISAEEENTDEIDWGVYLKEGQLEFFQDYKSDSESVKT